MKERKNTSAPPLPFGERVKRAIGVKGHFKTAILPMINYIH